MTRQLAVRAAALLFTAATAMAMQSAGGLTIAAGEFRFDGKPLQIISGEMHYARVPPEYWRDRMKKARAMGLNTISTYVFWNFHEQAPGEYDFSGPRDIARYIRTAQEEGLHVILRPGPYVCAEWELGGYPGWLFAEPGIVLRSTDPKFTAPAAKWLDRLGRELAPLLVANGGPIMAVQVENEYGSFDKDKAYLTWQRDALRHAGFGSALLYTADGGAQLPNGTLPDLPAVVNFGAGGAEGSFARLAAFRPGPPALPLMSGEYWAGWFDQWGGRHAQTNADQQTRELTWMLERGYSVNLYMFHGGTTFGFMNGANIDRGQYHPQTTSYDYDSALDESGRPTPKYFAFRDAITKRTGETPPPVPGTPAPIAIPTFRLGESVSLWTTLDRSDSPPEESESSSAAGRASGGGAPRASKERVQRPRSMETFGQSYGYILYRTHVTGPIDGALVVGAPRDYVQVFVNGAIAGTIDRRTTGDSLDRMQISIPVGGAQLDILVENTGRVNFNKALLDERKGILGPVTLNGRELTGWDVGRLPMAVAPDPPFGPAVVGAPMFYRGSFDVADPGDTFLDTRGWGRGTVWINGHHLGRFWSIGPQQTLYVPGPWLRKGRNDIVVFDLERPESLTMSGLARPVLDQLNGK